MIIFGQFIIYIIMLCALLGCISLIVNEDSELGCAFLSGIDSIGPIFLPVAGIMAASPIITNIVGNTFGTIFGVIGADPAMAATTFIAIDMGGYQLANELAQTKEGWIMAMMTGYMAGATIVFTIPVSLKIIKKEDRKYLALGIMSGLLAIPIGVLAFSVIIAFSNPIIRGVISTNALANYKLALNFSDILINLMPLIVICIALSLGLKFKPKEMIKGFNLFGRFLDASLKLIFVLVVIEYFTGLFSNVLGEYWLLNPIIATEDDIFRALEVAGAIGIMLCGAFPMVYLLKKYMVKYFGKIGKKCGLSPEATTALFAASANVLAALALVKDLKPKDKIIVIAFSVCAAFLFGDHLSFTANFQPNLILPVMIGKIVGGVFAIFFALKIAVPKVEELLLEENNN